MSLKIETCTPVLLLLSRADVTFTEIKADFPTATQLINTRIKYDYSEGLGALFVYYIYLPYSFELPYSPTIGNQYSAVVKTPIDRANIMGYIVANAGQVLLSQYVDYILSVD